MFDDMEIYDVVEAINAAIRDEAGGYYVLHRSMEIQPMKIYKKFLYTLYFIKGGHKDRVLTYLHIARISSTEVEQVWAYEDREFLIQLLTWFKYGKLANESISDTNN